MVSVSVCTVYPQVKESILYKLSN
ncbi:protein of unknown function [Methanoculleus bourgensis]|uniref:Uncharacterized protein n=1 Tax=Methanoculleus bourgensis TaxID=83986 RepID=A0A0X3BR40_9EURY|nr:protein of unknown function [Methanoculleus bourgensis]